MASQFTPYARLRLALQTNPITQSTETTFEDVRTEEAGALFQLPLSLNDQLIETIVETDNAEEVQRLISAGADIETVNPERYPQATPLFLAIKHERIETAALLIRLGANLNTVSELTEFEEHFFTSVELAVHLGSLPLTKLLIQAGADLSLTSPVGMNAGQSCIHIIASMETPRTCDNEILRVILEHNVNPNFVFNESCEYPRETPLTFFAGADGDTYELVQTLVEFGADIDMPNRYHETPIEIADNILGKEEVATFLREIRLETIDRANEMIGETRTDLSYLEARDILLSYNSCCSTP